MAEQIRTDARTDFTTAYYVDRGLRLSAQHGVYPAMLFMEGAGVPRPVVLRVLCSPKYFRKENDATKSRQAERVIAERHASQT